MHKHLTLTFVIILGLFSCAHEKSKIYSPSIEALESTEMLIMDYEACHWGCTKGEVVFRNSVAKLGQNSLRLTAQEIIDLDAYFKLGEEIEGAPFRCSLPIHIAFKTINDSVSIGQQEKRLFPCSFKQATTIDPGALIDYLKEQPDGPPYWRLSPEEQNERASLVDTDE